MSSSPLLRKSHIAFQSPPNLLQSDHPQMQLFIYVVGKRHCSVCFRLLCHRPSLFPRQPMTTYYCLLVRQSSHSASMRSYLMQQHPMLLVRYQRRQLLPSSICLLNPAIALNQTCFLFLMRPLLCSSNTSVISNLLSLVLTSNSTASSIIPIAYVLQL